MINNKEYSQERMIRHIVPHFLKAYVDFSSNSRESIKLIREEFLEISWEIKRIEERYNISLSSESSIFINHYSQKLERELTWALWVFWWKGNKYKTIISIYEKIEANHNINLSEQKNRLLSIMNEERVNKVTPVAEYPNQKKSNSNWTEFYGISQASDEELEKFLEENSGIWLSVMWLKDVIKKWYPMTNNLENIFTEFLMKNK
jgi:hypothetical protein